MTTEINAYYENAQLAQAAYATLDQWGQTRLIFN